MLLQTQISLRNSISLFNGFADDAAMAFGTCWQDNRLFPSLQGSQIEAMTMDSYFLWD